VHDESGIFKGKFHDKKTLKFVDETAIVENASKAI
jgi:hypothetical protein